MQRYAFHEHYEVLTLAFDTIHGTDLEVSRYLGGATSYISIIEHAASDTHPRVRYAWLHCIGQLSVDLNVRYYHGQYG